MKNIVCAIEEEIKFMTESNEGHVQYRKGYIRALEVMSDFVSLLFCRASPETEASAAVERMLSSVSLQREGVRGFRNGVSKVMSKAAGRERRTNSQSRRTRTAREPEVSVRLSASAIP